MYTANNKVKLTSIVHTLLSVLYTTELPLWTGEKVGKVVKTYSGSLQVAINLHKLGSNLFFKVKLLKIDKLNAKMLILQVTVT